MKMQFEHNDVCKALVLYLRTQGYSVDPSPHNFLFSIAPDECEIEVEIRGVEFDPNARQAPSSPTAPAEMRPAIARAPAPAPRRAPPPPKKHVANNDLLKTTAPPVPLTYRAPRIRVLDRAASKGAGSLVGYTPPNASGAASEIVNAFEADEESSDLVFPEEAPDPEMPVAPPDRAIVLSTELDEADQAELAKIMEHSEKLASQGPHFSNTDPAPNDLDDTMGREPVE